MQRRQFITGLGAATAAATQLPAVAQGTGSVNWRLASSFPKTLDTIFGGAERLAARVAQLTDNKFQIKVHAAGELMPALGTFDATQKGEIECSHSVSYYFADKNTALAFDAALPFGMQARQHNAWYHFGGGRELIREVFAQYGMLSFPGGATGTQMGGWYRKTIRETEDLKGLKMRIGGYLAGKIISKLGVQTVSLPAGEIVDGLKSGKIDAAEWIGPYDDERLGLHKVTSNYYYPGWWEPNVTVSFHVNKAAWDKLPKMFQAAFETAAAEVNLMMMAQYDQRNPEAAQRLVKSGAVFLPMPSAVMYAARDAAAAVYEEESAKNPLFKKLFEAWRTSLDDQNIWFKLAEGTYSSFVQSQRVRAREAAPKK